MLIACSSTGVYPVGGDVYFVSKRSTQFGFGQPYWTKADIYSEANEFCNKINKSVETVNLKVTDSLLATPGQVSLEFRCVNRRTDGDAQHG